jgi:anti-sigma factor (TIGR02949 family)
MSSSSFSSESLRDCREVVRLLGAYLDGELDAAQTLEIEEHVSGCESCRERALLDRATRGSLKKAVKTAAPEGMRARMAAAMVAERARGEQREKEQRQRRFGMGSIGTWGPLSAAAAVALYWAAGSTRPPHAPGPQTAGLDPLAELVHLHQSPLPPERTDPREVSALEKYVGVPVHPVGLKGARLVGGRVLPVNTERAAMLQYEIGEGRAAQRVSLFIYDPQKIKVGGEGLASRTMGAAEVRVGTENGYSVAVTQHAGVGYALASDLDEAESAEIAARLYGE